MINRIHGKRILELMSSMDNEVEAILNLGLQRVYLKEVVLKNN